MMSSPTTPNLGQQQHRQRTQQQRFSTVEEFQPYRDDPTIAPKLQSKTWGGLGPVTTRTPDDPTTPWHHNSTNPSTGSHHSDSSNVDYFEDDDDGGDRSKKLRHFWKHPTMISCCRRIRTTCHDCCTPTIPEEEEENAAESERRRQQQQQHSLYLSENNPQQQQQQQQSMITKNYYYIDDFNDLSYECSFGTSDSNGIWMNRQDPAGTMMCGIVWVLISYSIFTITLLAHYNGIPIYFSTIYSGMAALALATHIKTSLTDPGSVPASAVPTLQQRSSYYNNQQYHKLSMCSQCQTYKPPGSHHCRICHRCISHMDHHCPWMNNCIGAGNMKHFLLFLCYTWICSVLSLSFFGYNYFFCSSPSCMYNIVLTQLVRFMTVLAVGALLFTSSMLMNVIYGIMTGVGTIDRLKKKATQTILESDEEPIPLIHIFGMNPYYTWFLPIDPIFPNYDTVMGYSTPQRLLREQMRMNTPIPVVSASNQHPISNNNNSNTPTYNNNYNHNHDQFS